MRFDHAVIAVRDLAAASERLRAVGFEVRPGGRHLGFGTENALVRFGLDYLELITVCDEAEAERASARSRALAEFLRSHGSGFVGFALAADDLDDVARRLRAIGQEVEGPTPMRRRRPDGTVLEWRLLIPGAVAWRRPWPFFISWSLPDAERLTIERPGSHLAGVAAVSGISVQVEDLERARALYAAVLGPPAVASDARLAFRVGDLTIELVGPSDGRAPGLARGPGPFELRLRLKDPGRPRPAEEVLPAVLFRYE